MCEKYELYADIIATKLLLYRIGYDEIASSTTLFTECLNDIGFRTITGKRLTTHSLHVFLSRISKSHKNKIMIELELQDDGMIS